MKKMSALDRILLLVTGVLAAYQIVVGIDGLSTLPTAAYTIAFGVLLVAGLLLIIFGFDVLDSPLVVIVAAIIPLSLSLGLVAQYLPPLTAPYLVFAIVGLSAIAITCYTARGRASTVVLAVAHGIAGFVIFGVPTLFSVQGKTPIGFAWVGIGGALIGLGGLLLAFLKAGKPILSEKAILTILPGLLLLMMAAFVGGFALK